MTRLIYSTILILSIIASLVLYIVSYDSKNISKQILEIKDLIKNEKSSIQTLEAELSLLSQPDRIQTLSQNFNLILEPIKVSQIGKIEDIPIKPANKVMDELVKRSLIGYSTDAN
ncbi:MAG: hypothetical protein P8K09_03920 [Hyphomicrobiales bacterium]|nr:hypothetical protein [Hyphomicrobiales bacterium]